MISQKLIERINELVGKKTFKYSGELIPGATTIISIEYKFKITGVKKMISVGEYYDYLLINVTITGLNDPLSRLVFGFDEKNKHHNFEAMFKTQLYPFYNGLNQAIASYLRFFDNDYVRITIDNLNFDLPESKPITESRMSRVAVRTTVKDVVYKLKDGKSGNFRLPNNDDEYIFTNLPFSYTVDLTLEIDNELEGYKTTANHADNDVIELLIRFNPKTLKKNFYNIIGELNDIIAHELEHLHQYFKGEDVYNEPPEGIEYYLQPQEIKSQRVGFRRLAKLRKLPYKQVIQDWFDTHKETHDLNDEEVKIVINTLLNK
jgi:hypothetical protein